MNYMIVYHANCIDGITAATVTTDHLTEGGVSPKSITLCSMSYDDDPELLMEELRSLFIDTLYIVDFSFTKDILYKLGECVRYIHLLDHHASAFRNILGADYEVKPDSYEVLYLPSQDKSEDAFSNIHVILDNNECGASLCYKQLIGVASPKDEEDSLPTLIKYVKDYDLWRFKHADTKAVNKSIKQLPKDLHTYTALLASFEAPEFEAAIIKEGNLLLTYEDLMEDEIIAGGTTPITINGVKGLCCNAPYALASNIGHKLALQSRTFGAIWVQQANGKVNFSLRSNKNECDVSKLAEVMGGGGHKNAAGFSFLSPNYDEEKGITLWTTAQDNIGADEEESE